ncbi:hypothetical protein SEVIR_4G106400v4 [Setaria viridis]|uniref:Uncharacterized protein n=2 Tax=Setaria TaxID=4554 RepID=K3Y0D9_SETIT|nr:uncharacterized protein LOC101755681 [Setaria italica]XP_034591919.1 uncharacterized protein LOC117853741 [Setaria viridis]RCV21047.1 hypothetical protein SETIT_4G106400v2 [Setaria italica]TKW20697.1 hypothetical protein SEVIR_4G106400v2 [Setaria viridis]
MQRSNSFGTSWADQWDYGGDASPRAPRDSGHAGKAGGGGGVGEKTKAAAATGLRKVKEGTAHGFQWIKDKCQKKSTGGKKQQGSEVAGY